MTKFDALDWRAFALCADRDPELFFPVAEAGTPAYAAQVDRAKAVCRVCPVAAQCLAMALEQGCTDGVFGGLDAPERRALRADELRARHAAAAAERRALAQAAADAVAPAAPPAPVLLVPDRGGLAPGGHCRVCTGLHPLRCGNVLAVHYTDGRRCTGSRRVPRRGAPPAAATAA